MNEEIARPCDVFLQSRGCLLEEHGFVADPGEVQQTVNGDIVLYHYTRPEYLDQVLRDGLQAQLPTSDYAATRISEYLCGRCRSQL